MPLCVASIEFFSFYQVLAPILCNSAFKSSVSLAQLAYLFHGVRAWEGPIVEYRISVEFLQETSPPRSLLYHHLSAMASSPSSISGRRSRPGCMGTIAHLFDFNQAVAGRKLLTDKKHGAGLGPLKDVSKDSLKSKSSIKAETQLRKSEFATKRSSEVPIKALIAEDISEEPKNRAPSVVARLMGLDELPRASQSIDSRGFESYVEKVPSSRLQHGKGSAESTLSGNMKLGRSPVRSVSNLSISKRSSMEVPTSSFGDLSQEHCSKEEYGSWKGWKAKDETHMQAPDDLDSQFVAKQMLIKKKLSEAKLGPLSKDCSPKERLYESKEFMDAIDFLQANKDFFVRFLNEPDSLFAKHIRNNEESRPSIEQARRHSHGGRPRSWTKEPPDLNKRQHRSLGTELLADCSVSLLAQQRSMELNVSKSGEHHHRAPIRIVVLKPAGPGKAHNVMPLSKNSPRSPREFFDAVDVTKESSMDVLQELREKLQQEDGMGKMKHACYPVNEPTKASKDPREIAREIARQVRENVTRDLRARAKSTMLPPHGSSLNRGWGKKGSESEGTHITLIASTKRSHEGSGMDRSCFTLSSQLLDRKSTYVDEPRRSLDQPSITRAHVDGYGESSEYYYCDSESATCEERRESAFCKNLPRSRSMPTSSSSLSRTLKEVAKEDKRMPASHVSDTDGIDPQWSSNGIVLQSDPLRRSVFRRRGSALRGSLSKSKKQIKEVDASPPFSSQEMSVEKSTGDVPIRSEKMQHHIDDSGPIPDSDSSVSSSNNFLKSDVMDIIAELCTTETEDRKVELDIPFVQILEDSERLMHSPLVSPCKVTSLENDGTMSVTSEASKGASEQPSPVSVLDAPFHEEPEISTDFSDISSGLQELRIRLQLLKFGEQDAVSNQEEYQKGGDHFTDDNLFAINVDVSDITMADTEFYCKRMKDLSSIVSSIECPLGKEPQLEYVSNLLVAAGFMGGHDTILMNWHAPNQPLVPTLLKKLEEEEEAGGLSPHMRHLLLDSVNEVLLHILGPLVNCRTSRKVPYGSVTTWAMPFGKDLVQQVWAGICRLSQEEGQGTLGDLVAKDLSGKDRWCDLGTEIEAVVLDVQSAIYDVLIEEILTL